MKAISLKKNDKSFMMDQDRKERRYKSPISGMKEGKLSFSIVQFHRPPHAHTRTYPPSACTADGIHINCVYCL
jgi:hypothetical protein